MVFIAAATTWTVQEAWLTWRAGPHASCPERGQEQLLPELKQARLPPVSGARPDVVRPRALISALMSVCRGTNVAAA